MFSEKGHEKMYDSDTKEDIISAHMQEVNIMSRKPLSIWEKERKEQFNKELKEYSVECLHQIYQIATKGMDMRTRLMANEYIIDKCFGKDYKALDNGIESLTNNVTINLISTGKTYQPNEDDEQEIWEVENNIIDDDNTSDLDDGWGETDIYMPSSSNRQIQSYRGQRKTGGLENGRRKKEQYKLR